MEREEEESTEGSLGVEREEEESTEGSTEVEREEEGSTAWSTGMEREEEESTGGSTEVEKEEEESTEGSTEVRIEEENARGAVFLEFAWETGRVVGEIADVVSYVAPGVKEIVNVLVRQARLWSERGGPRGVMRGKRSVRGKRIMKVREEFHNVGESVGG